MSLAFSWMIGQVRAWDVRPDRRASLYDFRGGKMPMPTAYQTRQQHALTPYIAARVPLSEVSRTVLGRVVLLP